MFDSIHFWSFLRYSPYHLLDSKVMESDRKFSCDEGQEAGRWWGGAEQMPISSAIDQKNDKTLLL